MVDEHLKGLSNSTHQRRRRVWFVSGLLLWIVVLAAVLVIALEKQRTRTASESIVVEDPSAPAVNAEDKPPEYKPQNTELPKVGWSPAGVQDFAFTERSGRKVTKADLLGHPWLISFIFTRCAGPCPRVSAQMSALQKLLEGTDVRLVTLTVDPDFDTAEVLDRYAKSYRADPKQWLYLTGDKRKTYELINQSFLMPVKETTGADREPGYEVLHSTNILLVNAKGVVVQKYNATNDVDMARLRRDLKPYLNAKTSAAAGKRNAH